jgi:hypothetical protein
VRKTTLFKEIFERIYSAALKIGAKILTFDSSDGKEDKDSFKSPI